MEQINSTATYLGWNILYFLMTVSERGETDNEIGLNGADPLAGVRSTG
jgi:hypothetical protein